MNTDMWQQGSKYIYIATLEIKHISSNLYIVSF